MAPSSCPREPSTRSKNRFTRHTHHDFSSRPPSAPQGPRPRRGVHIIHIKGPRIVTTDPRNFRSLVQNLTGLKGPSEQPSSSAPNPTMDKQPTTPSQPMSNGLYPQLMSSFPIQDSPILTTNKPILTPSPSPFNSNSNSNSSFSSHPMDHTICPNHNPNNVLISFQPNHLTMGFNNPSNPHINNMIAGPLNEGPITPQILPLLLTPLAFQEQLQQINNNNNNNTNKIPNNISNKLHSPNTNHSNPHHTVDHDLHNTFLMPCDDEDHELGFSTSTPNIVDCIEMSTSLNSMGSSPNNSLVFYGDNSSSRSSSSSSSTSTNELNVDNYNYSPTMTSPSTRLDDGDDHEHDNDESMTEWDIIYGLLYDIPTNIGNNKNMYNPNIPPLQCSFNVTTTSSCSTTNFGPRDFTTPSSSSSTTNFGPRDFATPSSSCPMFTSLVPTLKTHENNIVANCHHYSSRNIPARFL